MKVLRRIPLIFLCVLVLLLPACKQKTSDEEAVRAVITRAASAVEAKDLGAVMSFFSRAYSDDNGNDYKAVKGILFYQFMRPGKLTVFLRGVEIAVKGERAVVNARVFVVRGRDVKGIKGAIPKDAQGFRFSVIFRKEEGAWKVLNAAWTEAGLAGLL